jgi:uncharacterized membrane protein YecN with MAPEG domain
MSITLLYAGLLVIWFLVLSVRVVKARGHGANLGDGGDPVLLRRIRGHGNFAEYVPLTLLLMAMLEFGGMRDWVLHALGVTLVAGRLLHGVSLSFTEHWKFGRFYGTLLTFIVLLAAGGLGVYQSLCS